MEVTSSSFNQLRREATKFNLVGPLKSVLANVHFWDTNLITKEKYLNLFFFIFGFANFLSDLGTLNLDSKAKFIDLYSSPLLINNAIYCRRRTKSAKETTMSQIMKLVRAYLTKLRR